MTNDEIIDEVWAGFTSEGMSGGELSFARALVARTAMEFAQQMDTAALVSKAKALVDMLDDAERNHGSLVGTKTLTAVNELRVELQRWK